MLVHLSDMDPINQEEELLNKEIIIWLVQLGFIK